MTHAATQHGIELATAKLANCCSYEDAGAVIADTAIVHGMRERINKLVEALETAENVFRSISINSDEPSTRGVAQRSMVRIRDSLADYRDTKG